MQLQNQANKIHDKTLTLPLSYYCNRAPCQTTGLCAVPRVSKDRVGRVFSCKVPRLWNQLPVWIWPIDTLHTLIRLQTCLFGKAYSLGWTMNHPLATVPCCHRLRLLQDFTVIHLALLCLSPLFTAHMQHVIKYFPLAPLFSVSPCLSRLFFSFFVSSFLFPLTPHPFSADGSPGAKFKILYSPYSKWVPWVDCCNLTL